MYIMMLKIVAKDCANLILETVQTLYPSELVELLGIFTTGLSTSKFNRMRVEEEDS